MNDEPWTFEPLELEHDSVCTIYDPNTAELVATFYNQQRAQDYLDWVNREQAGKQAEKDRRRAGRA